MADDVTVLREMAMFETVPIVTPDRSEDGWKVTRVPGGWIFRWMEMATPQNVFVPDPALVLLTANGMPVPAANLTNQREEMIAAGLE